VEVLGSGSSGDWVFGLPLIKLLAAFSLELFLGWRALYIGLGTATAFTVLLLSRYGFVTGPTSIFFRCH
jgi:hypothetical protein